MPELTSENVFEIIGVYFANCYWNNLYKLALDAWRDEQFNKMDEAYKTAIERYSKAFCAPSDKNEKTNKHYLRIVKDLYINYREFLQTGDTLLGFIDIVSKFLLPGAYYKTLSSRDPKKDIIFKKILTKTVMKFTIYISQEEIGKVINENSRKDKKHVVEWKKKFIDILTQERNEFCTLLLAQNSGIDIKNKDDIPQIPKEVCDKLQLKIKNLIVEKSDLVSQINKYAKYIKILKKHIIEKDEIIEELENETDDESETDSVKKPIRKGGNARPITRSTRVARPTRTSRLSHITKKPQIENKSSEPLEPSEALEDLQNEEYSGEEFENNIKPVNIEEVELPSDEFKPDD